MKIFTFFILSLFCMVSTQAFTILGYSPSNYNANVATMNSNLGIDSSYIIEDFEDGTLIPGLSIQYSNGSTTPLFNGSWVYGTYLWDGSRVFSAYENGGYPDPTFSFATGVAAFGIGISNAYLSSTSYPTYLRINGTSYGTIGAISGYTSADDGRNIYIRVVADAGEVINSIKFDMAPGDYISYDHLAVRLVPELSCVWLVVLAIGILSSRVYRKEK